MVKEDPGSKFSIGYVRKETAGEEEGDDANVEKEIAYIYFQTSAMGETLKKYPEVLQMDVTYKVNKNDMHLANIECIDNHGKGRLVGHALIHRETTEILTAVTAQFKRLNPEAAEKVETIFVDKDRKEISAIRQILPNAVVHLCHVHVMRVFKSAVKKDSNKTEVYEILKSIANSASKDIFDSGYEELKKKCSPDTLKYFDQNWKDIPEKWVAYTRKGSVTLGIRSTNHIESKHGKIKRLTKRTDTIAQNIRSLRLLHRNCELESGYRDYREVSCVSYVANCDDPEVQEIMNTFVHNTAKLLVREQRESKGLMVDNVKSSQCDCEFFTTYNLKHCRHIFSMRREEGKLLGFLNLYSHLQFNINMFNYASSNTILLDITVINVQLSFLLSQDFPYCA